MQTLVALWGWICANPAAIIITFIIIANILWSVVPVTDKTRGILNLIHSLAGGFVTHAGDKGTFTWPYVLKVVLALVQGKAPPSPTETPIPPAK